MGGGVPITFGFDKESSKQELSGFAIELIVVQQNRNEIGFELDHLL
jgi:hypothetical protein